MAGIITTVSAPFILLLSIPLAIFALLTTFFAFWVLLFRVSIVYAELFTALIRAYVAPLKGPQIEPPRSPVKERSPPSKRASRSSSVGSDLMLRVPGKSESFAALATHLPTRDYEGVGGWRLSGDDNEEALWMGINRRLELPTGPARQHRRSFGAGSRVSSGRVSPDLARTPIRVRTPGRERRLASGTASPEEYFSMPLGAMSTMDRSSRVSFDLSEHTRSGSNSTASVNSVGKITRQDPI